MKCTIAASLSSSSVVSATTEPTARRTSPCSLTLPGPRGTARTVARTTDGAKRDSPSRSRVSAAAAPPAPMSTEMRTAQTI